MITLIICLVLICALLIWSATTTCSLRSFEGIVSLRSQLSGPDSYRRLVQALRQLPGVRVLEGREHEVLVSVMPVPSSLGRGWGLFVVARLGSDGEINLAARRRLPLPGPDLSPALEELERVARQRALH
jgi:hypothetical protein